MNQDNLSKPAGSPDQPASTMQRRYDAVRKFMDEVRALSRSLEGDALRKAISGPLVELGLRQDLFPREDFAVRPGTSAGLYMLWRDDDGGLALYASAGKAGKKQPPHNHTTWAVIAGVYGEEHNVFMRRTDDGSRDEYGKLERIGELTVVPGNAARLDGEIFHTIAVVSPENALHLHLYGNALDTLSGRINFDDETGGRYRRFMAVPATFAPWVSPAEVHAMLVDGEELALLDVRESGVHAKGHIFHAASLPLSVLELRIGAALPRKEVRIILVDDDDGLAIAAARRLQMLGYTNLAVLRGGQAGWHEAGLPEYSGVHVPSKAFGEVVEHFYETPSMTAQELETLRSKQDVLVLDSRTADEFHLMSIPGGLSCPGGELVARALRHPGRIVVNCAGRTRSIIGAQSLISAGKSNVTALRNGTMGQHLAGLPLDHGRDDSFVDMPVSEESRQSACRLADSLGIERITRDRLDSLLGDKQRTCYLFDVRLAQEWQAGTIPSAVSAPGGQLIQQTEHFAPVTHARMIVFDTEAVQAPMAAFWLRQMGWEVFIYHAVPSELAPHPRQDEKRGASMPSSRLPIAADARIIDVGDSRQYRARHLPGAVWTVRSRLAQALEDLPSGKEIVLTCADGRISQLAAQDARALGHPATHLHGGIESLPPDALTAENPTYLTEVDDVWYRPYDRKAGVEDAMHEYLSWETGLLDRVLADGTVQFRYHDIASAAPSEAGAPIEGGSSQLPG